MPKPLTPETRARLREAALARRQWEHCTGRQTGPKTADGKRRSACRGMRHGMRTEAGRTLRTWIASVSALAAELKRREEFARRTALRAKLLRESAPDRKDEESAE